MTDKWGCCISYQVMALKIYNKTMEGRQNNLSTIIMKKASSQKENLLWFQHLEQHFFVHLFSLLDFSSLQHRFLHNWISALWLTKRTCFCVLTEDKEARHKSACCCEMQEVPTYEKGSQRSGRTWPEPTETDCCLWLNNTVSAESSDLSGWNRKADIFSLWLIDRNVQCLGFLFV